MIKELRELSAKRHEIKKKLYSHLCRMIGKTVLFQTGNMSAPALAKVMCPGITGDRVLVRPITTNDLIWISTDEIMSIDEVAA